MVVRPVVEQKRNAGDVSERGAKTALIIIIKKNSTMCEKQWVMRVITSLTATQREEEATVMKKREKERGREVQREIERERGAR